MYKHACCKVVVLRKKAFSAMLMTRSICNFRRQPLILSLAMVFCIFCILRHERMKEQIHSRRQSRYCRKWNDIIFANREKQYIVQLCYQDVLQMRMRPPPPTINEANIKINGTNRSLTYEELQGIPDDMWKKPFDEAVYQLYPLSSNINDTIKRILNDTVLMEVIIGF